ncbi:MAG TPA: PilZ domain-containing protein [Thermoanaerobaculia bacterium]|nr:PilZ domain-containing protein [Thermoanaerobaculia bacterium]
MNEVLGLDGENAIPAATLEAFLRDRFLALYQAEAMATLPIVEAEEVPAPVAPEVIPAPPPPPPDIQPVILRSVNEFESKGRSHAELRIARRYIPRRQFGGFFRQMKFTVLQISNTGLRIRHDDTFLPGDTGRLTITIQKPPRTFAMQAKVVWTSVAQRGKDASFGVSGLRITEGAEQLREALELLHAARDLQLDNGAIRPRVAATPSPSITGLSDDDVASIIRTVRLFESDPVEANRWFTRARFALADEEVRKAAPQRARERDEAIGVWEYLDRKLDLRKIAGVLLWLQRTRSASA